MVKFFGLVLVMTTICGAQVFHKGSCPKVTPMENFDPIKYSGKWYEWGKYKTFFQIQGQCDFTYIETISDGTFKIVNTRIMNSDLSQNSENGILSVNNSVGNGIMSQNFTLDPKSKIDIHTWSMAPRPYIVLGTDYSGYSVVYTCKQFKRYHAMYVWLYTRSRIVLPFTIQDANSVLDANNIDHSSELFIFTNQLICQLFW